MTDQLKEKGEPMLKETFENKAEKINTRKLNHADFSDWVNEKYGDFDAIRAITKDEIKSATNHYSQMPHGDRKLVSKAGLIFKIWSHEMEFGGPK